MSGRPLLGFVLFVLLAACGRIHYDTTGDTNTDATTEMGVDAALDANVDAELDFGTDAGVDMFVPPAARILVSPTSGLMTNELGGTAMFSVVLDSAPSADVAITLHSDTPTEGTASPSTLTFTSSNWDTAQTVVVTGVNDSRVDGAQDFIIVTDAASSLDVRFAALNPDDVLVSNLDDDSPSVLVSPTSGLTTTEGGGTSTFSVGLGTQPFADVTIVLASDNALEGSVAPATLTFTTLDWNVTQAVTVTGIDDLVVDGDVDYSIVTSNAVSLDDAYNGLVVPDVSAVNTNDDVPPEVIVTPSSGLVVDENSGTVTFTMVLAAPPLADVTVNLSSSDIAQGTVSPGSVTFSPTTWSAPQTVTITGVPDHVLDGDGVYTIVTSPASSGDGRYNGLTVADASVTTRTAARQEAYVKASNTDPSDLFGVSVALSSDGNTMVVGARDERSNSPGINGDQSNNSSLCGAAYVFVRTGTVWTQQAYIKASAPRANSHFGTAVALSADGNTLAIGDPQEPSGATGVGGVENDTSLNASGAVYMFTRSGTVWTQVAYIKASNTGAFDGFGSSVAMSGDGFTLAVGAPYEDSSATGIGGDQSDNATTESGATYVFAKVGMAWSQQAYIKASNTKSNTRFGDAVALSSDGNTLASGSPFEGSCATGIDGDQADTACALAGASYIFVRAGVVWTQQAYIKASNTESTSFFGDATSLSSDGNTLAVGAPLLGAGYAYVFTRTGVTWTQQAILQPNSLSFVSRFGWAVSLSGSGAALGVTAYDENRLATGINDFASAAAITSGSAFLFRRAGSTWSQHLYIKASNTDMGDAFGWSIAIDANASTLATSALDESSAATGIDGIQSDNSATNAGACYVFTDPP